jgi:hypothetical protein
MKFATVPLAPDMPTREASRDRPRPFQQIIGNEPAVLKDDAEGVHQMRIGFAGCGLPSRSRRVAGRSADRKDQSWLNGLPPSHPARELDVLIARVVAGPPAEVGRDDIPKLSRCRAGVAALAHAR